MTPIAAALKKWDDAKIAAALVMKNEFPVGCQITWPYGNGKRSGEVVGHSSTHPRIVVRGRNGSTYGIEAHPEMRKLRA